MPTETDLRSRLVVALGGFDGVHLGHQRIVGRTRALAVRLNGVPAVMTFDPLPAQLIYPDFTYVLTPLAEKARLLTELGMEAIHVVRFDQTVRRMRAEDFVRQEVVERLGPAAVVVGHDFRFGSHGRGDAELLGRVLRAQGIELEVVPEFVLLGGPVRSTRIRERLLLGDVRRAAELLGRFHALSGVVVPGTGMGRKLGFPTLNLRPDERETLVPADGVYVCRVEGAGRVHDAVLNIGHRPTFGGETRTIEAHLLPSETRPQFLSEVVNDPAARVTFAVMDRIRPELRFDSPEALAAQIRQDITRARQAIASLVPVANLDTPAEPTNL
jgi:riboflavin kinase/FMN adenylyltransferase